MFHCGSPSIASSPAVLYPTPLCPLLHFHLPKLHANVKGSILLWFNYITHHTHIFQEERTFTCTPAIEQKEHITSQTKAAATPHVSHASASPHVHHATDFLQNFVTYIQLHLHIHVM